MILGKPAYWKGHCDYEVRIAETGEHTWHVRNMVSEGDDTGRWKTGDAHVPCYQVRSPMGETVAVVSEIPNIWWSSFILLLVVGLPAALLLSKVFQRSMRKQRAE
mmetsp:Transcript_60208/g.107025  ORF Transcript_60208/g.107025 Transcript_60208/m.107025 type:complete len:105 (-) Transcript_60208:87-401(-)